MSAHATASDLFTPSADLTAWPGVQKRQELLERTLSERWGQGSCRLTYAITSGPSGFQTKACLQQVLRQLTKSHSALWYWLTHWSLPTVPSVSTLLNRWRIA